MFSCCCSLKIHSFLSFFFFLRETSLYLSYPSEEEKKNFNCYKWNVKKGKKNHKINNTFKIAFKNKNASITFNAQQI